MAKVDIIKAQVSVTDRRGHKAIERKRVAAYCRVSTDSEDQLNSYRSQVQYYTDKISENVDWMMAGIYADEAITGTQVAKREGFQKMINDCMNGQIDMVITKSISRFARNTLDTLKYVRMLKEKDIAVFFEDENINTLFHGWRTAAGRAQLRCTAGSRKHFFQRKERSGDENVPRRDRGICRSTGI